MAKRRITQTTPNDSHSSFLMPKISETLKRGHRQVTPTKAPKWNAGWVGYKSSTVAEMGDRARSKWAEKWRAAVPLSVGGARSPSNTMWPGPRPTYIKVAF